MFTTTDRHARLAQLQRRYARVVAIREGNPDRFKPSPFGPKYKTLDERCNDVLGHLRLAMGEIWQPRDAHSIYMGERLTALAEHVLRERSYAAALTRIFPITGRERAIWSKLDEAHSLIRQALDMTSGEDQDDDEDDLFAGLIDDIEVIQDAA